MYKMYTFWNKIKGRNYKNKFPPGLEPGTLSVLDSRDNHYTTETLMTLRSDSVLNKKN